MYHYVAYPFDIAKTNRILNTSFNRECGENLGKELVALYNRGQMQHGVYRGMLPLFGITFINSSLGGYYFDVSGINLLVTTTLTNPLNTLMTHRQVINSTTFAEPSYRQVMSNWGANIPKLFTLGYTAALTRNALLMTAFLPKTLGSDWAPLDAGFAFGALIVSHPFEVARTLIVCQEKNRMIGSTLSTLQSLYSAEGVAGLYKGLIPRLLHTYPVLLTLVVATKVGANQSTFEGLRTNPIFGSLKLSSS